MGSLEWLFNITIMLQPTQWPDDNGAIALTLINGWCFDQGATLWIANSSDQIEWMGCVSIKCRSSNLHHSASIKCHQHHDLKVWRIRMLWVSDDDDDRIQISAFLKVIIRMMPLSKLNILFNPYSTMESQTITCSIGLAQLIIGKQVI